MSSTQDLVIYGGPTVRRLLEGQERRVMEVLREAYSVYAGHACSLPQSTFLRFGQNTANRIIALPAYVGGRFDVAGFKWVASFPENRHKGLDRASATLTLNEVVHGRPVAVMEASSINAHRTAGSAAIAAQLLCEGNDPDRFALVGCGYIGAELANYLLRVFPSVNRAVLLDSERSRAEYLRSHLQANHENLAVELASDIEHAAHGCPIVCFATSAGSPWISRREIFEPESVVLHISLRDLSASVILECNNVVDDIGHVCREKTSVHLAEMESKSRAFIGAELPFLIDGSKSFLRDPSKPTVFSPFGLGILDVALGHWIMREAARSGAGDVIRQFFPTQWGAMQPLGDRE